MGYEVWIYTNKKPPKYRHGSNSLYIDVVELKPYDGLSKRFKKYTHTIQYTEQGKYVPSDYYFQIYNPNGGYYSKYIFKYKHPLFKLKAVYIFFKNDDSNNNVPLILGFDQESYVTLYFTYKELCDFTNRWYGYYEKPAYLPEGSFREDDLLTRLLEEIGPSVGRVRKFVINLNQKPRRQDNYPVSGPNSKKITVKKEHSKVSGYDKYEHIIPGGERVEEFYVSYGRNSRYIETGYGSGYYFLDKVAVYYKTGTGGTGNPVLFTFSFRGRNQLYVYSYQDFVNDLKNETQRVNPKTIRESDAITDDSGRGSELRSRLQGEIERLKPLIEFLKDTRPGLFRGRSGHKNITIGGEEDFGQGKGKEKFKRVVMRPDTSDQDGPWIVYSSKLFTRESRAKIDESVSNDIFTTDVADSSNKYKYISVYYVVTGGGNRDYKALLVEFVKDGTFTGVRVIRGIGETKIYFRRDNREGTKWVKADGINTDARDNSDLLRILHEESNRLKQITFLTSDPPDSSDSSGNQNIKTAPVDVNGQGEEGEKFIKVTMTPNTNTSGGGSSSGPWTVYSTKLISRGSGKKMKATFSGVISGSQYSSISVYYSTKSGDSHGNDDKALLVEFDDYGDKTYFKREDRDRTKWAITHEIRTGARDTRGGGGDMALLPILEAESERLKELIEFVKGDDRSNNVNISKGQEEDVPGNEETFKKISMTPNTKDVPGGGGSPVGPWTVYNDKLFNLERGAKIQENDGVLSDITTGDTSISSSKKYSSITVYYAMTNDSGTGDNWALLVKFDKAGIRVDGRISSAGETKYYKRENQKGDKWADATGEMGSRIAGGHGDSELLRVLQEQWEKFRPLITFVKGSGGGTDSGGNEHVKQELGQVAGGSEAFNKVTFKPDTSEAKGGGWTVYSSKLITRGFDTKIEPDHVLDDIVTTVDASSSSNKYRSITVYYTSNQMALLVEFCAGDGSRKYIKRGDRGGTQWTNADDISSRIAGDGGDAALAQVLTKIKTEAFGTISSSSSTVSRGSSVEGSGAGGGSISSVSYPDNHVGPGPVGHSEQGESEPGAPSGGGGAGSSSSTFQRQDTNSSPSQVNPSPSPGSQEGMSTGTKAGIGTGVGVGGVGGIAGFAFYKYPQVFLSLIGK